MSITVRTQEDSLTFDSGTKWHIDEARMLHVIDANGTHIAAFGQGQWSSVERATLVGNPESAAIAVARGL